MAYAENTSVDFEKSIAEIVGLVRKRGADDIMQRESRGAFTLQFTMSDRAVRFRVQFPDATEIKRLTGPRSNPAQVEEQWRRQRGRALLLVIRAKLESIESGVETFEQAFLANVVLPDGSTVYDRVAQPIAVEYNGGAPSTLLLGGPER